jgi:hypothetical protein
MAKWQNTIDFSDWTRAYEEGEATTQEVAAAAAKEIAKASNGLDEQLLYERDEIVYQFDGIANDDTATVSDFNNALHALYDWADTSLDGKWNGAKVAWVVLS